MHRKSLFGIALTSSLILVSQVANASISLITGTGDPITAIPGGNEITFESILAGRYTTLTTQGVTFTPAAGTAEYINSIYAGSYNTTGQSLQNTYASDAFSVLTISFASPVSALAFNWGAADTNWLLTAYDGATNLGTVTLLPTTGGNAGTYDGLQSTSTDITSVQLYVDLANLMTTLPDYVFIDNFTTTPISTTTVPEPSTWAMTLLGFAGLGFLGYRRGARLA